MSGKPGVMMSKREGGSSQFDESVNSSDRPYPATPYQYPMDRQVSYGGYHQREGLVTPQSKDVHKTSWWYIPNSRWTWLFLSVTLFQAMIALAMEGYIFWRFGHDLQAPYQDLSVAKVIPTYLSLFIFGFIYQLFLTYDALRLKNTIQIIGLCLYNLGLTIEAAVQYDQIRDAQRLASQPIYQHSDSEDAAPVTGVFVAEEFWPSIKPFAIALPIFLGVMCFILSFVTWKLNDEFAWSIYKHISADLRLKRRYLSYQIYVALLKFDFFFFLAFTVQFLVIVPRNTEQEHTEFWLTVAAVPVTVILLFLAAYWTRRESVYGMLIIIVVYIAALAYFCFKLFRMYLASTNRVREYRPARNSLTTFAAITIVTLVITTVYAVICTINFNKGLKPHIMSARRRRKRAGSSDMDKLFPHGDGVNLGGPSAFGGTGHTGGGNLGGRMEID